MRDGLKTLAHIVATLVVSPMLASFHLRRLVIGRDRALEGSTQALAWLPGLLGVYLRRAFLCQVLAHCDRSAAVHFGTIFSQTGARLDANTYVGPGCHLGLVHLERDVMIASGVHIPSGAQTHGTEDTSRPMQEQTGRKVLVTIGEGAWVGSAAVVMADVGRHSIVAAGSVVTRTVGEYVVVGGVPAKVIADRRAQAGPSAPGAEAHPDKMPAVGASTDS